MAAGDRNENGKPTDIVRHIWGNNQVKVGTGLRTRMVWDGKTVCGRSDVGYASDGDWNDVTCINCLKKREKLQKKKTHKKKII
jgi:hypothetical protein